MTDHFEIAVIGAGLSGIYMGEKLREAGISHKIFEKADEVGGTWRDNTYPGLYIDVLTRSYEYSFARSSKWTHRYAPGSEIQDYLVRVSRDRKIVDSILFNTEIRSARFTDGVWELETTDGRKFSATVVVCATGFLRVPNIPSFPGMDDFEGYAFHSSRWDHSIDYRDKRVGVIGTGSSGVQIVTELGRRGVDVTHFIRTPQWMMIRKNPKISFWERLFLALPGTGPYWDRRMIRMREKIEGPASWRFEPGPERERIQRQYVRELEKAVPDPELRAKLMPTEEAGCKRIAKTENYYKTVRLANVAVSVGPISSITPQGIVDADGNLHELDVIVHATGFQSHAYMHPMAVEGANGKRLDELWKDGVYSYYGIAVPEMPNFFLLNGPFAPINLIPIPALLEDEVGCLMQLIDVIRSENVALAPTKQATSIFVDEVRAAIPRTTFGSCPNWFTDQSGTPVLWPWPRTEHGKRLRHAILKDFVRTPIGETPRPEKESDVWAGHFRASLGGFLP